jgi:hypothetical protein
LDPEALRYTGSRSQPEAAEPKSDVDTEDMDIEINSEECDLRKNV